MRVIKGEKCVCEKPEVHGHKNAGQLLHQALDDTEQASHSCNSYTTMSRT